MKFYLEDNVEIEISSDMATNIIFTNKLEFDYNDNKYIMSPIEFKINDIYYLLSTLNRNNKKIFINRFEKLSHDSYVMYYAIEN